MPFRRPNCCKLHPKSQIVWIYIWFLCETEGDSDAPCSAATRAVKEQERMKSLVLLRYDRVFYLIKPSWVVCATAMDAFFVNTAGRIESMNVSQLWSSCLPVFSPRLRIWHFVFGFLKLRIFDGRNIIMIQVFTRSLPGTHLSYLWTTYILLAIAWQRICGSAWQILVHTHLPPKPFTFGGHFPHLEIDEDQVCFKMQLVVRQTSDGLDSGTSSTSVCLRYVFCDTRLTSQSRAHLVILLLRAVVHPMIQPHNQ